MNKPYTFIDQEMLDAAIKASKYTTVNRTKASKYKVQMKIIN